MSDPVAFLHELEFRDIPEHAIDNAIRGLTDTIGVAIAGSTTRLSKIIHNHAARQFAAGGNGGARLWQDGRKVSATGAALANGMTIDAVDGHDGYKPAKGHVACGLLAGLLAITESENVTDVETFLTALVAGYEVGSRAGVALHGTVSDYHTSGAWIAPTVAGVASRVMGLNFVQLREAIGIAEYHGPRSQMMRTIDHPTMVKDGSGWGAMAGISAAYLAADGFTGAPAVSFEHEDAAPYWADLGKTWLIGQQYIKLYPVCRWAQPPIEAALNLINDHDIDHRQIARVDVITFHEAARLATRHPKTTEEAQYSLPYSVAAAIVHGTVGAEHVADEALNEPVASGIRERIVMGEADEFNAAFPQFRRARVLIELTSGKRYESPPTEAKGDPENPVGNDVICEKFMTLSKPVIGEERSRQLLHRLQNLPGETSISTLLNDLSQA